MSLFRLSFLAPFLVGVVALAGCGSFETIETSPPEEGFGSEYSNKRETVFGVFLWRASLDTVSFMPVNSADVFGGVILTDWHSSAEAPNERFKINVYILGRELRADGLRVTVFRQIFTRNGQWADATLPAETETKIEDSILTRARQLRNTAILQKKQ